MTEGTSVVNLLDCEGYRSVRIEGLISARKAQLLQVQGNMQCRLVKD